LRVNADSNNIRGSTLTSLRINIGRTTWDSRHRAEFGDNGQTSIVSDHSNPEVTDKHYTAKIEAAKMSINFCVFPKTEDFVN
jgi:hypothetical protein